MAQIAHNIWHGAPKSRTGRILGYVAQNRIPRAPSPPTTPHFCGFHASKSPNEPSRPPYQWSLGGAGGQHSPRTVGANGGSIRVPEVKKITFFKVVPRPLGMLKQVFLGRFEPWWHVLANEKCQKALKRAPFWDQKRVKNGSKRRFSKSDWGPFGKLKQVFLARFEPVVARFGPWKMPKCLEIRLFGDRKWVKNGSKTRFSKSDRGPFGKLKQVFLARFEPVVARFGPWKIPKCLENGLFGDRKWVKKWVKTRFSKSDPGPLGMLKQVSLAHFEPKGSVLAHGRSQNALKWSVLGPKMGQKWVKNAFFQK